MPVYAVQGLQSPCLFGGFGGQAVYVAPEMAGHPVCLHHVLVHENCHLQQLDYIWSLVRCLLTALYWFNPLIWLAAFLSKKDCELACDELAVRKLGEAERFRYGETLISLVSNKQSPFDCISVAVSMSFGGKGIRERVKRLAQKPKAFGAAVFAFFSFTSTAKEAAITSAKEAVISSAVPTREGGYRNIALLGVDVANGNKQTEGRNDTIMILSMNQDSGECKLLSVYRDTYLNIGNNVYAEANGANAAGGPVQAVNMLNRNRDLNITDYLMMGYEEMISVIDALGGIMIDVKKEEVDHLNNYQTMIGNELDRPLTYIRDSGNQLLDGMQAIAYTRIRYTKGDDYMRVERQQRVIQEIAGKLGKTDSETLREIVETLYPDISSSLDLAECKDLLAQIGKNGIAEAAGFPIEEKSVWLSMGTKGSCIVPNNLEENVAWVHSFLFGEKGYTVSGTIKEFSSKITDDAAEFDAVHFDSKASGNS